MPESWIDDVLGDEEVRPDFEAELRSRVVTAAERRRRPRWMLPAAAALVAVAGVGTVAALAARDSDRSVQVEPSIEPTSPPVTTSPASTTTTPIAATVAPTTVPPITGPPPSSAIAPLPPTVASEPSTSTAPPTEPTIVTPLAPGSGALDLRHGTVFGLAASSRPDGASAVDLISRSLGAPASDVTEMTTVYCPDPTQVRVVRWNDLVLVFLGAGDTEHLSSWQLGDPVEEIAIDPVGTDVFAASGITTADGVGIGSPAASLDSLSPIAVDAGRAVINGDIEAVAVTITDGAITGFWSGPWDWDCGDEPR